MKVCPECGSKKLGNSRDGLICRSCGTILGENYFSGRRIV